MKKFGIEKGKKLGEKSGIEKGKQIGEKSGIEKGKKIEKLGTAKKLLELGVDIEKIVQATGLTREEIESL